MRNPSPPNRTTSASLLVVVGVLLTLNLLAQAGLLGGSSVAHAGQVRSGGEPPTPFPNNAEFQRKQTEALADIANRIAKLEAKLDKPLQVKVIEMPPMPKGNGG